MTPLLLQTASTRQAAYLQKEIRRPGAGAWFEAIRDILSARLVWSCVIPRKGSHVRREEDS